jgi:very-short-patch-repair endonuclease
MYIYIERGQFMQYKCEICEKEFKTLWGLSSHSVQKHDIKPRDLYIKFELNNEPPTCKCGCGEETNFLGIRKGFTDYIRGHSSRINNNWGHNPKVIKKSHETQKKMYESGELVIWNKGLTIEDERVRKGTEKMLQNTERGDKISNSLKGKKRPKHVLERLHDGMVKYWSSDVNREKQRYIRKEYLNTYQYNNKTKLELKFEGLLISVGLEYQSQYVLCGYNFDYYLPTKDVVIEVDGDFWHCNPSKYPYGPIYHSQKVTLRNDKKKNLICENTNGLTFLRFWESDINDRPDWVIEQLNQHI